MTAPYAEPAGSNAPVRASALIAQALVERQSAGQVVARATELGLPRSMVEVIVAACGCETAPKREAR